MPTRTSYAQRPPNRVDLQTSDQAFSSGQGVFPFHTAVAGLTVEVMDMGDGQPYAVFKAGEAMVGGVLGDPPGAVFSVIKPAS